MPLPAFDESGNLPEGFHVASLSDVVARFGFGSDQRNLVTDSLRHIHSLAMQTGKLDKLIVFGSYVSDKLEPNDVDVILVLTDEFRLDDCPSESLSLFDHSRADTELGASIFWIRPGMLLGEPLEQFLSHWQTKRGGGRRGIVEIRA